MQASFVRIRESLWRCWVSRVGPGFGLSGDERLFHKGKEVRRIMLFSRVHWVLLRTLPKEVATDVITENMSLHSDTSQRHSAPFPRNSDRHFTSSEHDSHKDNSPRVCRTFHLQDPTTCKWRRA